MKIGVALSDTDISGVYSYRFLYALNNIHHLSVCGTAALGAMLFAHRLDMEKCDKIAEKFISHYKKHDIDSAIDLLCDMLPRGKTSGISGISVHCADTATGEVFAFCNDNYPFPHKVFPLTNTYDALSSAVGKVYDLAPYRFRGQRLESYSTKYGAPVYPFDFIAVDKILNTCI